MKDEKLLIVKMILIKEPGHQLREKISEEGLEELKSSMGKRGLIQPIELRPIGDKYEIVAGHRRFLAAQELGWTHIKALIKERSDEETFLDSVHENLHREDMSPLEEAKAAKALIEKEGKTVEQVARMFSKTPAWVVGRVDMLEYPQVLKDAVESGALSLGAARELSKIHEEEAFKYYLEYAIRQGATAQLCAFWRGRWEVERVQPGAIVQGEGAWKLQPPPGEPELQCQWCDLQYPIRLLNHLRTCPKCTSLLMETKVRMMQDEIDRRRQDAVKEVVS